jgi:small GTP-binding protein
MSLTNESTGLQKKVCLLGAFGVGKTSLTRRYVYSIFSDSYLTTVGVKIDKKTVRVGAQPVTLLIWDIAGEDEASSVHGYLRGAAGYLLVVDVARAQTLEVARSIQARVKAELGDIPFLCLLNKTDLPEWAIEPSRIDALAAEGWTVLHTSAKTGTGVDAAFTDLAQRMLR